MMTKYIYLFLAEEELVGLKNIKGSRRAIALELPKDLELAIERVDLLFDVAVRTILAEVNNPELLEDV